MATGTLVAATGTIDRGPESRTIYHCVFYDSEYANHLKKFLFAVVDVSDAVVELS